MDKVIVPQALYDQVKSVAEGDDGPLKETAKLWLKHIAPNAMLPVEPKPIDVSQLTLRDFGWAPGGYNVVCIDCPKDIGFAENGWGAKRSWRCEKHAQQRLDEAIAESAPAAGAPKSTVDG